MHRLPPPDASFEVADHRGAALLRGSLWRCSGGKPDSPAAWAIDCFLAVEAEAETSAFEEFHAVDVDDAVREILRYFVDNERDTRVIYFDGWNGFGASAVLRAVADEITSLRAQPKLHIDKVVHIDCSAWKSRRALQRVIAVELKLDASVMEDFDEADEEDDINEVDESSRCEILSVSAEISRALRDDRFIVVFHNGSGDEIDLLSFGIPPFTLFGAGMLLWTFGFWGRFGVREDVSEIKNKVKNTHLFLYSPRKYIGENFFLSVVRREATAIAATYSCLREMDPERIIRCCMFGLFLCLCFPQQSQNDWTDRASNYYWMCDGIIQADQAWEICDALSKEIKWDLHPGLRKELSHALIDSTDYNNGVCSKKLSKKPDGPQRPKWYPWITIITSNKILEIQHIQANNEEVSFYFLAPENQVVPLVLAEGLFNQSTNLHVLLLSHCVFSFSSPPFTVCENLRFLGLDHCIDSESGKPNDITKWKFLHSLWFLDLISTYWYQVFFKEIANLMVNLRELKVVGLDLPKNTSMESLPNNLSKARSLQVLVLDGCCGLEDVVLDGLPLSLKSFSLDGYRPALKRAPGVEMPTRNLRPSSVDSDMHVKTSKISLEGCIQLEKLFLRRLPNLVELDLSGTAIKILDFTSMVVKVSSLKRLFLLGCAQLRAIKWGDRYDLKLELLCIDTRPGIICPRPSVEENKYSLLVHAVIVDARLARSLLLLIKNNLHTRFDIHITSSTVYSKVVQHYVFEKKQQQYHDVITMDAPIQSFPQPPTTKSSYHIEISQGSHNLESELVLLSYPYYTLAHLMTYYANSLHVHDVSTSASMPGGCWRYLKWCRIERCPKLEVIFPTNSDDFNYLETIWVSDLLMARWIWTKGSRDLDSRWPPFQNLRHLQLRSCPRLQFVLPLWVSSFPKLETIHVIHCTDLRNVFVLDNEYPNGVEFPKLTSIHLHDLPMLRQICEVKMVAPALRTIKIRGCWGLRRLPVVAANGPRPAIEIEKDVWDALEWDDDLQSSFFQPPLHSHYYRKKLHRGSILRFVTLCVTRAAERGINHSRIDEIMRPDDVAL
ncbi:hypothetical protein ABZP36_031242 [Zizania latifolia]